MASPGCLLSFILGALIVEITPVFEGEDPEVPRAKGTCLQPHSQDLNSCLSCLAPGTVSNLEVYQVISVPCTPGEGTWLTRQASGGTKAGRCAHNVFQRAGREDYEDLTTEGDYDDGYAN